MPDFAHERITAGLPMPGILVRPATMPIGTAIEELSLGLQASDADEWISRVAYLPLR